MALKWGARRQILYYVVAAVVLGAAGLVVWQVFLVRPPTCTDKIENGQEQGVDCGGICAAICPNTAKAPTVLWARSFESSPHIYTAAAYIQNNNIAIGAGAKQVHYTFELLDDKNILVAERQGVFDIPPAQTVPVVEIDIDAGQRDVAHTFFKITDNALAWQVVGENSTPTLRVSDLGTYENGRLTATVANTSFDDAKKVQVIAILFDSAGVARGASRAIIAKVTHKSSETVTFTWPESLTGITRTEVTVLPSF